MLLIIREIQIKIMIQFHSYEDDYNQIKWKYVEKLKPSFIAGEFVKWYTLFGKVWWFLKKLNR